MIYKLDQPPALQSELPSQIMTRPIRLVQCSDMHLFADPDKTLLGLNTQHSFDAVHQLMQHQQPVIDIMLVTGDIAQEPKAATYQRFLNQIRQFKVPLFFVPGNHDLETIYQHEISLHQLPCEIVIGSWCIILLNSSVTGEIAGCFNHPTLSYLEQALSRQQDKHILIAFHHNPLPVGCAWLDQHMLKSHAAFFQIIDQFSQVRIVLHGHVHQVFEQQRHGVTYLSCPSTSLQFLPGQPAFKLDDRQPGYRWLDLMPDGQFNTQVSRVTQQQFFVDHHSNGY